MSPSPLPDASRDQLTGWKEIASYLGKSVRTVQRWEQRFGLPVHRVPGASEVVLASREEIERWKRSEASTNAADLDGAAPAPGRIAFPHAARRLTILAVAVIAVIVLVVHLARRPVAVERAAAEDDEALLEHRPYLLQWNGLGEQRAPQQLADGRHTDPGFVTFEPRAVVFEYVKLGGIGRARPCAFARLQPRPESPRLRFEYVPHSDARISHWAGFADATGFIRSGQEPIGYWLPRAGVALRLDRTSRAYTNSRAGLWVFVDGVPRPIAPERPLSFQLEPGRRYPCAIEIDGWWVSATVSDGARVDSFVGNLDRTVAAGTVFIADAHDGVSSLSPNGRYQLRFEKLAVHNAIYRVNLSLESPPAGPRPALSAGISLVIHSNRNVDATALDQASLRVSGVAVLPGNSSQGFACRPGDMSGDGVIDLVCQFDRMAMKLDSARPEIVLAGRTTYGRRVGGYLTLPKRY